MKKFLFSVATVALFVACNNTPKADTTITPAVMNVDSINRSQADKNQAVQMNGVSDTIIGSDGQVYVKSKPGQEPAIPAPVKSTVKNHSVRSHTTTHHSSGSSTTNTGGSNSGTSSSGSSGTSGTNSGVGNSGTSTTTTTTTEEAPKKKGWSNAAKGTAIGAASGAVAGAIISKNKGVGAVVGGLIGAGGGYIIGRKKDKKKQAADSTNQ